MWGACIQPGGDRERRLYDIYFQVFRATPQGAEGCYDLVGFNFIPLAMGGIGELERCIVLEDIPPEDQIQVEPGDVVGFYAAHYLPGETIPKNGSIQLDIGRTDVTVWYVYNMGPLGVEASPTTCQVRVGPGNELEMQTNHPPVITAQVCKLHALSLSICLSSIQCHLNCITFIYHHVVVDDELLSFPQ